MLLVFRRADVINGAFLTGFRAAALVFGVISPGFCGTAAGANRKFGPCRSPGIFHTIRSMSPGEQTTIGTSATHVWDAHVIFELFGDPVRRRLILALARDGWLAPSQLKDKVGRNIDATMKRLVAIRANGMLAFKADTVDKRRQLCSLVPTVPIVKTDKGRVLNFGYLSVPLDAVPESNFDPDTVYFLLGDPGRRKLLRLLFEKPLQTGLELANGNIYKRDGILKQLVELRSAGLVVAHENPGDGRRQLYSLAPGLPLEKTDAGTMIQLGFCAVMI